MTRYAILLVLLFVGCNLPLFAPTDLVEPWIEVEFEKAQKQIVQQFPGAGNPYSIHANEFLWEQMFEGFKCGGEYTKAGCFTAPNRIRYLMRGSIYHESGHAILYALGDDRWRCSFSGHGSYEGC